MKKAALNDKWLVLFVCMTIAGGDFSYALPVLNSGVPTLLAPQNNLQMFTLPEHLGSVQELKDAGKNRPLIFYIQDAHGLKDSQENIQKLILYFQEHYRISVVGVEGARDEIDPTLLRTFPDEFIKKKVLNSYLQLGEVSGVDLAAALNPQRGKFYGIEDWPLYQENYAAYAEADKNQKEILEVIDKLKVEAEVERRNIYSVELGRFHEKTDAFQEEKLGILELADFLNGMEKKHAPSERQISESKTPHLWKLISAVQSDGGEPRDLDTAIRQMSDRFKKKLFSRLRLDKQREFNKQYQDYVTGMTDPGAYLKFLMDLGKEVGAKPKLSRGMRELLGQVETFSMIKGTQLFKELNEVLVSWEKVLTVSEEERKLAEKFTHLRMLKTIAKLELTREQLEDYQKDPEGHLALLGDKRALLSPALSFYQAALERDNAFMVKIKRILKKENVNAMVVLTGGFHSEGMRRHLKSGDWSYAIITPKINSLEGHDSYRNAMTGKLSYQKYLKKSFYDAFMQHAVFQLVKDYNEPEFKQNVKVWRDTVIKEMAAEGRLADAGEYTAYIDRLIAVYKEKYGDQIRIEKSREEILSAVKSELENFNEKKVKAISANLNQKVNWFMSAVNKLQEAGKWDQDNFSKLLKSADARGSGLAAIEAMANKRAGDGLLNFRNGETGLEDFAKRFGRESSQFGSAAVTARDMAANVGSLLNLTDTFARLLERLQKQADVSESGTEQGSAELYVKAAGELTELARREFPDLSEDVIPVITRQAFNQAVERILPATVSTSAEFTASRSEVRVEDSKSGGLFNYGPNRTVLQRFLSSSVPTRADYNASVNALIQAVRSQKISFVALYTQIMKDFPAAERERAGQLVFLVQKSLDFYPDGREVQLVKIGKSADSPLMPFPVEFYQGTMNASISDSDALKPGLDGMIWLSGNPNDRTVLGLAGFNPDGTPKEGVIPGKVLKRRYALKDGQIGFGEVNPGNDLTAESALADAKVQGIQARYSEENQWLMIVEHMNDPEMVYGINQERVKKGLPLIVGTEADFKARSKSTGAAPVSMSGKGQTSSGKGQLTAASQSAKTGKPADLKLSVSFEAFKPLTQVKSKKDVMPEQWAAAVNEILRALAAQNGTKLTPAIVTQLQLQYGSVIREEILSDLISYSVTALRVLGDASERSVQMVKINQRGDLGPMPRIFYKNVNEKSADGVTPLYFNKPKQGTYEAVEVLFKPQQIIESNIIARADISAANLQGGTAAYYNDMNQSVLYFAAKNPAAAQAEFRAARSELRANAYSGEINIPQLAEGQLRNAPQEFLDKGGWKLHLTVSKANAQKVHEWLWKNTKAGYKYGRNSGQEGKDFTIYVGSRSEANEIADKLVKEIADLLSPASGAALTDDMPMTESSSAFVLGRFDTNRRRVGENNADFNQYGAKGLPFLEGDYKEVSGIAIWGTDEEKKELERKQTEARDRAYKVLEKAYGDYFTGAPSGNDRRSIPQLKEGQLKDASEEFLEKGGWKLHLTVSKANAQKVHEWLWENIQSGYKYGKNSGQEGKDFTIYVGSRKEANEIADKMVREIAHLLSPASGSALTDDMPLTEGSASLVLGRFDTNRKKIGENAVEFNQYGAKGLPFLEGDYKEISGIAIWGTDEEKEELENKKRKAGQRAYKVLEGAYGEYFTGVPAAAPREEKIKVSIKSADDGNPITSEDKLLVSRALSVKGDNILQAAGKGNVKSVSVRRVLAQIFPGAPIIRSYYFSVTLQNGSVVEYQVSYKENKDKWELMSRSELRQREDEVDEISNAGQQRSEARRTAKYRLGFDDPDMARKFFNNPNGELLKKGAEGYVSRVEGAALAAGETIQTRLNQAVTLNDLLTIIESPELEKIALSSYSEGVLSVEFAPDEVLGAVAVLRGIPYGFFDQTAALFEAGQINAEAIDTFGAELDGLIGTNLNKDQTLGLVVAENQDLELTSKAVQTFIDEQVVGRLVLMYPEALKGMKPKIFKIANLSYVKTGANLAEDIAQVDQSEENRMGTPVSFMSNVLADLSKLSEQATGKVISANTSAIGDKKLQLTVIKTAIYVSLLLRQLEEAERKKLMKSPEAFKAFLEKNGLASVSGSILFGKQGVAVELAQFAAAFKAAAASA